MEAKSHILKLGLIGSNIAHSESPAIFKKAHPDWTYNLIDVKNFREGFEIFLNEGYDAVNVTAPYKTEAFESADSADTLCEIIGASNLLIREEGKTRAYNTDVIGATTCLKSVLKRFDCNDTKKIKVLVMGLGGAGKAATAASLMLGFETSVINRSYETTQKFQERLSKGITETDNSGKAISKYTLDGLKIDDINREGFLLREIIKDHDIIIYTLPLGFSFLERIDFSDKAVIEANYHSPSFPNLKCKYYVNGRIWLQAQAQPLLSL